MTRRIRIDFILVAMVFLVVAAGIFTLYTQESILEVSPGRWYKQLSFLVIGIIVALALRKANYQVLGDYALPFYGFTIFLLLITLVPFIGSEIKGARSWLRVGPFGFQTSELAKISTILLLAKYLELKEREMDKIPTLLMGFGIALLPMLLIVVQPDFGGAFAFAPILLSMLFVAGADLYHIGSVVFFFGISLSIPLYIEYKKITMVEPLVAHLAEMDKRGVLPAVRILKKDVWSFLDRGYIPSDVAGTDKAYLINLMHNKALLRILKEGANTVRDEMGGLLLKILENDTLIITLGVILTLAAIILFIIRYTQGNTMHHLRKYYIPLGVLGISFLSAAAVHLTFSFKYHQVVRITAFINPDKFPRDLAYQIRASKAAIGSGEFFGQGLFNGDMTMGDRPLVPEAYTDFIFTSWGERTGFFGSLLVLILLLAIPLRGMQISFEARDRFAALLGSGISFMFFYHVVLNIGIALGLLPVTGLPLSFMSYGGSHLIVCMAGIGVLLSIYKRRFAN